MNILKNVKIINKKIKKHQKIKPNNLKIRIKNRTKKKKKKKQDKSEKNN